MTIAQDYRLIEVLNLEEMLPHYDLLLQLNPNVGRKSYESMLKEMIPKGYGMVLVMAGDKCIGLSGYWINTMLWCGKYIEMDNVIIDKNYRSKGIGKLLLDWITEKGKKEGCKSIGLDAYVENKGAHKFYLREGFIIKGFHFIKEI